MPLKDGANRQRGRHLKLRLSIDRFEGDKKQIAVLLTDDGTQINFPKTLLPKGVKAGDILSLTIERDAEATRQGRQGDPCGPGRPEEDRPRRGHQAVRRLIPILGLVLGLVPVPAPAQRPARRQAGHRSPSTSSTWARATRS